MDTGPRGWDWENWRQTGRVVRPLDITAEGAEGRDQCGDLREEEAPAQRALPGGQTPALRLCLTPSPRRPGIPPLPAITYTNIDG